MRASVRVPQCFRHVGTCVQKIGVVSITAKKQCFFVVVLF